MPKLVLPTMPTFESMSKILEHVQQELHSFFEILVPRSLLYGGQASSSKTTVQEVKVEKENKANKIMLHLVKLKEEIVDLKVDPTFMKPYSHI